MAKRKPFVIGEQTILSGMRQRVDFPISTLSDHTPVTLSAHVVHGRREEPVIFVSAGIHGDEVIGVDIVRRLLTMPALYNLRGTLIAVPIVNTFGFLNQSRYLPDRRDLNRCFPGSEKGSLASRLAYIFLHEIVKRCDLGIDLHSAAVHRTNLAQIRISKDNEKAKELAVAFGAPVVLQSQLRDGSLRAEAKKMGVDVLVYESGEALRFNEVSARAGVLGILRILHQQSMIAGKGVTKPKASPLLCQSSRWVRAMHSGLLRTYKSEGDVVKKGDVLAIISDPFGMVEHEITATLSGVIVGRALLPIAHEGDALFHIARVQNANHAEDTMESISSQLEDDPLFDEDEII